MKNRLAVFLLILMILVSIPYEALAKQPITFQNNSSHRIYVAMHYKHATHGWLTHGWWDVNARSSRTVNFDTNNAVVYLFAKSDDGEYYWSGDENNEDDIDRYVGSGAFEAMGQRKPKGNNISLERFFYVEFDDDFTYEFDD